MSLVSDQCKDDTWLALEAEQFLVSKNAIHLLRKEGQTDRAAVQSFLNRRPDGLAIRKHLRQIALLEFTRSMGQDEEYQSRKEEEKDERYRLHRDFMQSILEKLSGNPTDGQPESWRVQQINFTGEKSDLGLPACVTGPLVRLDSSVTPGSWLSATFDLDEGC